MSAQTNPFSGIRDFFMPGGAMQTWGAKQGLLTNPLLHLGAGLMARSGYQPGPKQPFGALLGQSMLGVPEGVAQGQRINNLRERVGLISAQKQAMQAEAVKAKRIAELRAGLLGGGAAGVTYSAETPPGVTVNPMGAVPAPNLLADATPTVGPPIPAPIQSQKAPEWAPIQAAADAEAAATPSLLAAQPQAGGGGLLGGLDPRWLELAGEGDALGAAVVKEHMTRGRPTDPSASRRDAELQAASEGLEPGTPEFAKRASNIVDRWKMTPRTVVQTPGGTWTAQDPDTRAALDRMYANEEYSGKGPPDPGILAKRVEEVKTENMQREVAKEERGEQRTVAKEQRALDQKWRDSEVAFRLVEKELGKLQTLVADFGTEMWNTQAREDMNSAYTALSLQLKELAKLGALSGPDLDLLNKLITNPAGLKANLSLRGAKAVETQVNAAFQRLIEAEHAARVQFKQPMDARILKDRESWGKE